MRQKESIVARLHVVYWYIRFQHDNRNNLLANFQIVLITALDLNTKIVVHLKKGTCGKFAKAIFYFPCSVAYSSAWAKVTGKRSNFGDGEGMQVP